MLIEVLVFHYSDLGCLFIVYLQVPHNSLCVHVVSESCDCDVCIHVTSNKIDSSDNTWLNKLREQRLYVKVAQDVPSPFDLNNNYQQHNIP